MKKSILFLVVLFFINSFVFPETDATGDNTAGNNKKHAIELSIGGGLSHSIFLGTELADYDYYSNLFFDAYHRFDFINYFSLNIPFGFVYYFNDKFGLGFTHSFETGLLYHITDFTLNPNLGFSIANKFRIVNKIGKNIFKDSLLIEYGINLLTMFNYNSISQKFTFNNLIFGPSFLFGRETIYKNFSYMIGGTFDLLLNNYAVLYSNGIRLPARVNMLLCWGLEFRWRFSFIKEL